MKKLWGAENLKEGVLTEPTPIHFPIREIRGSYVLVLDELSPYIESFVRFLSTHPLVYRFLIFVENASKEACKRDQEQFPQFFNHPAVRVFFSKEGERISLEEYSSVFEIQTMDRIEDTCFLSLNKNQAGYQERIKQLQGAHQTLLSKRQAEKGDIAGSSTSAYEGFVNSVQNIPNLLQNPDLRGWVGAAKNVPALVLGAGPSFGETWNEIQKYSGQCLIFAADTLAKFFSNQKIQPTCFFSLERIDEVQDLMPRDLYFESSFFVPSNFVKAHIIDSYQGSKLMYLRHSATNAFFPFKRMVMSPGHSVVGAAIRVAQLLGCNPIIFSGVDLSWSQTGEAYANESPYEEENFSNYQQILKNQQQQATLVEANDGQFVKTSYVWQLFRVEFEALIHSVPGVSYFNVAEKGAKLKGAPYLNVNSLATIFSKLGQAPTFEDMKNKAFYERTKEAKLELKQFIDYVHEAHAELSTLNNRGLGIKEFVKVLSTLKFFSSLYGPLLNSSLVKLQSITPEVVRIETEQIFSHCKSLQNLLEEELTKLKNFQQEAHKSAHNLY